MFTEEPSQDSIVKSFKSKFSDFGKKHGFTKVEKHLWTNPVIENDQCLSRLKLERSSYSKLFYPRIYVYIKGAFNRFPGDNWFTEEAAFSLLRGNPQTLNPTFDLENNMPWQDRCEQINEFWRFAKSFCEECRTRSGVRALAARKEVHVMPAVAAELDRLDGIETEE